MIEDQFEQKVNLAIGSALTEFNSSHKTSLAIDESEACSEEETLKCLPGELSLTHQKELEQSLQNYMSCYGIDDKYEVQITGSNCAPSKSSFCCSIGSKKAGNSELMLGVSFETKAKYLKDKMLPMIISSMLIFLLLATVSFFILGSLIKQKRVTENNIDFFNNTAHELKTPLTNISLALKLLGKKYSGIENDKYAQIIKSENSKLSDQIERVLFLSKMENGEYVMKKEELDLNEIVKDVIDSMSLLLRETGGAINLVCKISGPVKIIGDYLHISNVFRNLIDNALKYCDAKPQIDIIIQEGQNKINVVVRDNGIGISPQDQVHVFQKFQRVNTGDVKRVKGFGIGLAYVKTVIEMHNGQVSVQSELNKGSEFKLLIPQV